MSMTTFGVQTSDELKARAQELLAHMGTPGERQGDIFERLVALGEKALQDQDLCAAGVDVAGLDAALAGLRSMVTATAASRAALVAESQSQLDALRRTREEAEKELRAKIAEAQEAQKAAEEQAEKATKKAERAEKDFEQAKAQADTAHQLAAEKDKTIAALGEKLATAEEKLSGYDDLRHELEVAKADAAALSLQLVQVQKDADVALDAARKDADVALDAARKDAEIAIEKAITEAQKPLHDLEVQLAGLQVKNESLAEHLAETSEKLKLSDEVREALQNELATAKAREKALSDALARKDQDIAEAVERALLQSDLEHQKDIRELSITIAKLQALEKKPSPV